MAKIDLIMPKMGESIMEATILNWLKKEGDKIEVDEAVVEIATDKVDSEIPSPVEGILDKILFGPDDVVEVGKTIAIIKTEAESEEGEAPVTPDVDTRSKGAIAPEEEKSVIELPELVNKIPFVPQSTEVEIPARTSERFYSPLVRNIAKAEGVSILELEALPGSGAHGRVTKKDILAYVSNRSITLDPTNGHETVPAPPILKKSTETVSEVASTLKNEPAPVFGFGSGETEVIQMDRMRKLIAEHMVKSKHTSAHVTSFVEADVTRIVNWRNKNKKAFLDTYGEKITYTPIFIEAVVNAIKDFPLVNVSVDGDKIIVKKDLNIGMAAALPSGNLIVPVIKNADHLNLIGITKKVNDLARRARANKLKPEEIQGGTFTITNVGTFGNLMGTPIINQPQVAILATGSIKKKPAVIETSQGDLIGIRSMMFLSLSYDHRVVDGFLGGSFLKRIADNLENFDPERNI
jgi:2-oxoglutarate dehydrogenase E2 component (dihydrolipoamide succinyltransferase)